MGITFLTQALSLFTDKIMYLPLSNNKGMGTDDIFRDDFVIIKELFETIEYIEEKGISSNRVSNLLECNLKRFISEVDHKKIKAEALKDFNNNTYWLIMCVYELANLCLTLVNKENKISCNYISYNPDGTKFILDHRLELNAVARRLLEKLHNTDAMDNETQGFILPSELNTPIAQEVFAKAIEKGYMTPKGNRYQWHQSNVLLAYLCGKLYSGDFIHKSKYLKDEYKKGELPFPEKSINGLFYDKTGKALANIKESRNGLSSSPKGYTLIDELFKEASN